MASLRRQEFSPGLAIGAAAPHFMLPDQTMRPRALEELMGEAGLYLLFVRSVVWCPFCKAQLVDLSVRLPELLAHGVGVAAVAREEAGILASFAQAIEAGFPLLSDPDSAVISAFGLVDEEVSLERGVYGVPYPGVLILGPDGRVQSKHFYRDFRRRFYAIQVLARAGIRASQARLEKTPGERTKTALG